MEFLIVLLVFIILVVGGFILYRMISSSTRVVSQEERLVIYRFGKFNRVVGPGIVRIYPKLDEVKKSYEVREHPIKMTIPGIFAFSVPNTFTLNLWVRTDPVEASQGDRSMLARLVQIQEFERREQIEVKIREALVEQVRELQQRFPLPDYATTFDGVVALAPGSTRYNALLRGTTRRLSRSLPSIGVILSSNYPITLTGRVIPDEIIKALEQKRGIDISGGTLIQYATQLKTSFPDTPDSVIAQIVGSIPGVDMTNIHPLVMEHIGRADKVGAKVEYELHEDGTGQINVQPDIADPEAKPAQPAKVRPRATGHSLSDSDLSILKTIPRGQNRKSA